MLLFYDKVFGEAGPLAELDADSCASIHALHSSSACSSAFFLLVKVRSAGSKRLISTVQFRSVANTNPFGRQSFPVSETASP
jgi:hypothetical protein